MPANGQERPQDPPAGCANCSLVPLTTTFTPPSTCSEFWTPSYPEQVTSDYVFLTRNYTAPACLPTEYIPSCATGCPLAEVSGLANISPGVCPDDYTVASELIQGASSEAFVTTHYCCPSDAPTYSSLYGCTGSFSSSHFNYTYNRTEEYTSTMYSTIADVTSTILSAYNSTILEEESTRYYYRAYLTAAPFVVRFKQEELDGTSTGLPKTSSSPTPSISSTSGLVTATTTPSVPGLSTGAKAGIGVGATIGFLAFVAIGAWLLWTRKRRADQIASPSVVISNQVSEKLPDSWSTAEVSGQSMPPKELPASQYREVNPGDPAELDDDFYSRSLH